ncbi:hypothetical protein [Kitasatospora cinereorecta]|uniref:hypothetical protein n=1 Tax=Streptomyces sp. NPDC057429 TaxID=3346130 RepID=UPI00336E143B
MIGGNPDSIVDADMSSRRLTRSRTGSDGCSGQRSGPLVQTGVRPEPTAKWDNVRLPG